MSTYKVIKEFAIFEYNPKTKGHKIKWFKENQIISQSIKTRMSNPDKYLEQINN
jgi:hypothetical protein